MLALVNPLTLGFATTPDTNPCLEPAPSAAFSMNILHVNDHHSHLEEGPFDIEGDLVPTGLSTDSKDIRISYGGFPMLVGLLNSMEARGIENVLKLHAGDAITGTSFYSLFKGTADAEMMSHACFDALALGNHEFDDGDAALAEFIGALHNYPDVCDGIAVLGANVVPGPTSPLKALPETQQIKKYLIKTLANGERVGIVGIDIRDKTLFGSRPDPGTELLEEKETATAAVKELECMGINKIVLLTHIGYAHDIAWLSDIPGVDVIVGGDSHSLLGREDMALPKSPHAPPRGGSFPTMAGNTCIVTAWEYAHGIGHVMVSFDEMGKVTSCGGNMLFPFKAADMEDKDNGGVISAADAALVTEYLETHDEFTSVTPDAATAATLQGYKDAVEALKMTQIATVPEDICFERIPGQGKSSICQVSQSATQGGGVCNLVAKAFLESTPTAHFAIQNAGGCRTDIAEGDFTIDDAYTLLPFSNMLVTLEMTGAEIKLVLEQALENAFVGGSTGAYPYSSGLRYTVDATADMGSRIGLLEANPDVEGTWAPIDMAATYSVVSNDYIAGGKDGYQKFAEVPNTNTYTEYAQGFINYAEKVGVLEDLPLSEYSTISITNSPYA
jgi:5'-nucleotidase